MTLNCAGGGWVLMLVLGILTLRSGRFYLAPNCVVRDRLARVIGWLFVLPLAICLFMDALVAVAFGREQQTEELRTYAYGISLVVALICPVLAVGIALVFGTPGRKDEIVEETEEDDEEEDGEGEETGPRPKPPSTGIQIIRRKGKTHGTDDRIRE
jgi:hypothetical protein